VARIPLSALPPRDWAAAARALDDDGVVHLPGALTADGLARVEAAVDHALANPSDHAKRFYPSEQAVFHEDTGHRMIDVVRAPSVESISDGIVALATPLEDLDTDDAIDAWLTANVTDYVHAVGTCRMGAATDPAAVVDTDCRVIGYEALRVCDASVMPDLPKANTHLTTVAIAERLVERMHG